MRLGDPATRELYRATVIAAFAVIAAAVTVGAMTPWALLALAAILLALRPLAVVGAARGRGLVQVLVGTSLLELVVGLLLAVGLTIGRL